MSLYIVSFSSENMSIIMQPTHCGICYSLTAVCHRRSESRELIRVDIYFAVKIVLRMIGGGTVVVIVTVVVANRVAAEVGL